MQLQSAKPQAELSVEDGTEGERDRQSRGAQVAPCGVYPLRLCSTDGVKIREIVVRVSSARDNG